jgi:hypothetical protein
MINESSVHTPPTSICGVHCETTFFDMATYVPFVLPLDRYIRLLAVNPGLSPKLWRYKDLGRLKTQIEIELAVVNSIEIIKAEAGITLHSSLAAAGTPANGTP